jgi:hypothetical protein
MRDTRRSVEMRSANMNETLLRETIREILRKSDISRDVVSRRIMMGEVAISDWDLARAYARGGRTLMTESQRYRGRILMEGLVQGIVNAAKWLGRSVSNGWASLKKMGSDAIDAAGRVFTMMLEAIPGGKEAFEMIKDFTAEVADQISEYIKEALKEFGEFIMEKKEEIIGAIFKGASDPGVIDKIKELGAKAVEDAGEKVAEVKKFFTDLVSSPEAAVKALFSARGILSKVAKIVINVILSSSKELRNKISNGVMNAGANTKSGKLVVRLMTLISVDMGGEEVLKAASNVWASIKGLKKGGVSLDHAGREFTAVLPDIAQGLISGEGALEPIIRSIVGDPAAAAKLLKNAIKMTFNALKNLALGKKGLEKALQKLSIDPDSNLAKAITMAAEETLGAAGGAAGVSESVLRQRKRAQGRRRPLITPPAPSSPQSPASRSQ